MVQEEVLDNEEMEEEVEVEAKLAIPTIKKKPEEKAKEKHRWVVKDKLPVQEVREIVDEKGTILHIITVEEALTQIMNQ